MLGASLKVPTYVVDDDFVVNRDEVCQQVGEPGSNGRQGQQTYIHPGSLLR
jgi:hypothetical protein